MKKALITIAILLLALMGQAQIKVHDNGHVSLGCLTQAFGVQVLPSGYTYFRTQINDDYSWANLSMANKSTQKHWIVENQYNPKQKGKKQFYVLGDGQVHSTATYITEIQSGSSKEDGTPINGTEALNAILSTNGYYYEIDAQITPEEIENNENVDVEAVGGMIADLQKKTIGLSGENLADVMPDAVRIDSEARLCINYNAVVTMLVEAMKQQQAEIETLRQTMQENGLMEK